MRFQPFKGLLTIQIKEACAVRVRIPDFVEAKAMVVDVNGARIEPRVFGNYLELGHRAQGDNIRVAYPLPLTTEEAEIGNPGFRHYRYRVTWKGDIVVRMEPLGREFATRYSEFDKREVPIFYGKEGPGPLYQREDFVKECDPELSPLHLDDRSLDFWAVLQKPADMAKLHAA